MPFFLAFPLPFLNFPAVKLGIFGFARILAAGSSNMDIRLPKLGEGADSGTVVTILVKEGDRIEAGQTLIELENEKAVAPIPSPSAGVITKLRVKEGDKLSVGQIIATLGEATGAAAPPPAAPAPKPEAPAVPVATPIAEQAPSLAPQPFAPPSALPPAASPSVRKMARELGIDLTRVRGSEAGGRIVLGDLRAYIQQIQNAAFAPKPAAAAPAPKPAAAPVERLDFSKWGPVERKALSPLRQTISRRMSESWQSVPRVTQFDDADITVLNDLRKKFAPAYEQKGTKLTVTSFVVRAVVATLKKHPIFNSSLDEAAQEIVYKQYYHLGLAVDTEHGLIVPVIRDADKKNLLQISIDINTLAEKARARKVTSDELQGGTFTISNQGGVGGAHFTPIVNKPEVAILGLGRGALKPVVRAKAIEPRLMLPLALSYDHRVIDGASAARFITDLVKNLEAFVEQEVTL